MKYLKLPEVNHKDYNYNSDDFNDFKKPLIIRGGCKDTLAYKNWNLNYICDSFEVLPSDIFSSKENMQSSKPDDRAVIIKTNILRDKLFNKYPPYYYVANQFIPQDFENIINDLKSKSDLYRMPGWNGYTGYNLFIGNETYTNSHLHFFQDFLVNVIIGKKIFYMWHVDDNKSLHDEEYQRTHYNIKNFWKRDHSKMKIYKAVLNEGDSMILPPWWYHAVYTPGFCIMCAKIYNKRYSPMYLFNYKIVSPNKLIKNITKIYKLNEKKNTNKKKYIVFFIVISIILLLLKNYY